MVEVSTSDLLTSHSVVFLLSWHRPVAKTPTWQHTTFTRDICAPGGIRTRKPSKRPAADLPIRPRGQRDRHLWMHVDLSMNTVGSLLEDTVMRAVSTRASGLVTSDCVTGVPWTLFPDICCDHYSSAETTTTSYFVTSVLITHERNMWDVRPTLGELIAPWLFYFTLVEDAKQSGDAFWAIWIISHFVTDRFWTVRDGNLNFWLFSRRCLCNMLVKTVWQEQLLHLWDAGF
jgi:hypothetical protein